MSLHLRRSKSRLMHGWVESSTEIRLLCPGVSKDAERQNPEIQVEGRGYAAASRRESGGFVRGPEKSLGQRLLTWQGHDEKREERTRASASWQSFFILLCPQ